MTKRRISRFHLCLAAGAAFGLIGNASPAAADMPQGKDARLARIAPFLNETLRKKIRNPMIKANWIGKDDRFWFRHELADGSEYLLVDAATGQRKPAFDHQALAAALGKATGKALTDKTLRLTALELTDDPRRLAVGLGEGKFDCDLAKPLCAPRTSGTGNAAAAADRGDLVPSPDGKRAVFLRDHDLWLRDLATGAERRLTRDGIENFAYGGVDAYTNQTRVAFRRAGLAPLLGVHWSPDGRYVIGLRQDLRPIPPRLLLTEYLPPDKGDPVMHVGRAAIARDPQRADSAMTIIDVDAGTAIPARIDPQSLNDLALPYLLTASFLHWDKAANAVFLIGANRGGTRYRLTEINLATGAARDAVTETGRFSLRLNPHDYSRPNVHVLDGGREAIWYSERDGWGHLYLYDVATDTVRR